MHMQDVIEWVKLNVKRPGSVKIGTAIQPGDDDICLSQEGSEWEVFYSSRGLKTLRQTFASEEEACAAFIEFVKRTSDLYPQ